MKGLVNWEAVQKRCMPSPPPAMEANPAEMWGKSATMYDKMSKLETEYTKNQLDVFILDAADSVLDIGCGPGRISVPVAERVARVTALDVAQPMLDYCRKNAEAAGLNNLTTRLLDWNSVILGENLDQHDVVIASRSVGLSDLVKLNKVAKKYVFILSFAQSPSLKQVYDDIFAGTGDAIHPAPPFNRMFGYNITFNMLYDMGIDPNLKVVTDGFTRDYNNYNDAYKDLRTICDFPSKNESIFRNNVNQWLTKNTKGGITFRRETKTYIMWWKTKTLEE